MSDGLFEVFSAAKKELEALPPWHPSRTSGNIGILKEAMQFAPFSALTGKILLYAYGSGPTELFVPAWIGRRLFEGLPFKDIVASARQQIDAGGYEVAEITLMRGVYVETEARIDGSTTLRHPSYLPDAPELRRIFEGQNLVGATSGEAALLQTFQIKSPVIDKASDVEKLHKDILRGYESRKKQREMLRRALLLTIDTPVEMPITLTATEQDHILRPPSAIMFSRTDINLSIPEIPDMTSLLATLKLLGRFSDSNSIHLAIDRIGRSRRADEMVDAALDIGMALEIMLMHENGSAAGNNQEISNKLSNRAAWLLGESAEERIAIAAIARQLYSDRSSAAHTGKLKNSKYNRRDAEAFVTRIISSILQLGRFPDWNSLVLGATP